MSGLLLSEETTETALTLVTTLAAEAMAEAVGAGVTLVDTEGRKTTAGATSELVARLDDLQYQLDQGPCVTAWSTHEVVRIDDLESDERWPLWRAIALPLGLRSTLTAPLISRGRAFGAVKVYGRQPAAFGERDERLLSRFGDQAAILLANLSTLDQSERLSERLQQALNARNSIALASGILMERHRLNQEQAFLRLVEQARTAEREVAEEAVTVIASTVVETE